MFGILLLLVFSTDQIFILLTFFCVGSCNRLAAVVFQLSISRPLLSDGTIWVFKVSQEFRLLLGALYYIYKGRKKHGGEETIKARLFIFQA